ncbi:MAG TPA: hypothetical protein VJA25_02915 [Dehalococcoidia bacterium]|nr:hypothetical protein [Dehalococcoidia bacterium]
MHVQSITAPKGNDPVKARYLLGKIGRTDQRKAVKNYAGTAHPLGPVRIAVLEVEAEGHAETRWERDSHLEVVWRPRRSGKGYGAENGILGNDKGRVEKV